MSILPIPHYNKILTFFSASDNFFHAAELSCSISTNGTVVGEVSFIFFALSVVNATKPVKGLLIGGLRSFFKTLKMKDIRVSF